MTENTKDSAMIIGEVASSGVARGLVAEKGRHTAHATILARARGIPLLIHVPGATTRIRPGDHLIVDGLAGRLFFGSVEDLHAAKVAIESAKATLAVEQQPFNPHVPVGAMIETPAAAIMTSRLAQRMDL